LLEADSWAPLAQLSSLRGLVVEGQGHPKPHDVLQLLSSAVQGCLLKIEVMICCWNQQQRSHVTAARAGLVAEKGSRNVPLLDLHDY
jgi:hypothetical protein